MSKARKQTQFYHHKEIELADGTKEYRAMPRNRAAIRAHYSNAQINARKRADADKVADLAHIDRIVSAVAKQTGMQEPEQIRKYIKSKKPLVLADIKNSVDRLSYNTGEFDE